MFADAIPGLGMSHGQDNQVAPGFLPENLNVPNQGDAIPPEINQVSLWIRCGMGLVFGFL